MQNTRFATVVHILSVLSLDNQSFISSDEIASSINIHPVIVRNEIVLLKNANWVESKKGKIGGCRLTKPLNEISFWDVFELVRNTEILGKQNLNPNPKCPIGKKINEHLENLNSDIDHLLKNYLSKKKLADFVYEMQV